MYYNINYSWKQGLEISKHLFKFIPFYDGSVAIREHAYITSLIFFQFYYIGVIWISDPTPPKKLQHYEQELFWAGELLVALPKG